MSTEEPIKNDPEQEDTFDVGGDPSAPDNNEGVAEGYPTPQNKSTAHTGDDTSHARTTYTGTPPSTEDEDSNPPTDISDRLSEHEGGSEERQEGEPSAQQQVPFDLSNLPEEQLQALKAQLEQTPARTQRKDENPRVTLPVYDGKIVRKIGRAYLAPVKDIENRREVERQHIPIMLEGESEERHVLYREFMNLPREPFEVTNIRTEPHEKVVGETWSMEKRSYVEQTIRTVYYHFTVKREDGSEVELEADIVNA